MFLDKVSFKARASQQSQIEWTHTGRGSGKGFWLTLYNVFFSSFVFVGRGLRWPCKQKVRKGGRRALLLVTPSSGRRHWNPIPKYKNTNTQIQINIKVQILKYTKGTPPEALLLVTPSSGRRHQNPIYIHIQKRRYKNTQIHQYTKPQIHKGDAS